MLDAVIGNQDRHHDNWGVIDTQDGARYLAPAFDLASCLGYQALAERKLRDLDRGDVASWAKRGRSNQFDGRPNRTRRPAGSTRSRPLALPEGDDGEYVFRYRPPLPGSFRPFPAFPDLSEQYRSRRLFPFFENRIMSPLRPDYEDYLSALGLSRDEATPFEMLARTGGGRATDTVQVVPEPVAEDGGSTEQLFLASGVRYHDTADGLVMRLRPGDELVLRDEPDNEYDDRAILLDAEHNRPVGWIPSYMLDEVHKAQQGGTSVRVFVERANGPDVPSHLRLLCRMRMSPSATA